MAATFSAILTAYLLGNFVFHTEWVLKREHKTGAILLHAAATTLVSYLLLGAFHWRMLAAILLTHLIAKTIQTGPRPDSLALFLGVHCGIVGVCLGLAIYFPGVAESGWWAHATPDLTRWYFASLSCASGIMLCVPAGGILIAKLIGPLIDEIGDSNIAGLKQGGRYIGWLERSLVMLLVLANQPSSIGFLIAAKSILRFGEIKDASQRKVAEYIIIGTFLSFGWGLLISFLTQRAMKHWIP